MASCVLGTAGVHGCMGRCVRLGLAWSGLLGCILAPVASVASGTLVAWVASLASGPVVAWDLEDLLGMAEARPRERPSRKG